MQQSILSTVHRSKHPEVKLLVAKDSMECILVSKIIQIKLLCKIKRCITIELCVHFGTKDWHQLYNLMDAHQWDDIVHMSIVIPEVPVQDEHVGSCCWYRNYGAIIVSSGRARELEQISVKEDCGGADGCRLYRHEYNTNL